MPGPIHLRPLTSQEQQRSQQLLAGTAPEAVCRPDKPHAPHLHNRRRGHAIAPQTPFPGVAGAANRMIDNNNHEVLIADRESAETIWRALKRKSGLSDPEVQQAWEELGRDIGNNAASYGFVASDAILMRRVAADIMKGGDGIKGIKAVFTSYSSGNYVVFKGHAGLRNILTGTRYGASNPKVVQLGLGKLGAQKVVKAGGILTVLLLCGFHVVDYFIRDTATLTQLIGNLGVDLAKAAVGVGMSFGATLAFGGAAMALGPFALAVFAGVLTSYMLDRLDTRHRIKEKVVEILGIIAENFSEFFQRSNEIMYMTNDPIAPATGLRGRAKRAFPKGF